MDRKYVIVCNKHKAMWNGCLLFWGHLTDDEESRSFGGYTSDIEQCERYTLEEIQDEHYTFPVYDEDTMTRRDFLNCEDIVISILQLVKLGYGFMKVAYLK